MQNINDKVRSVALAATPGPWHISEIMFNAITAEKQPFRQGYASHIANVSEHCDAEFISLVNPDYILSILKVLDDKTKENNALQLSLVKATSRLNELERRISESEIINDITQS